MKRARELFGETSCKGKPAVAQVVGELKVINKVGIHARPAAAIVQTLQDLEAEVFFTKDGQRVNGKSIMGVLMLAAGCGSVLTIEADGPDAADAVEAVRNLIESKFGEE